MKQGLIITISREYGSGGRQIGEKLAKDLNIPFYDKEIINIAAQKSGFDVNFIKKHEETVPAGFLFNVAMGEYYAGNLLQDQVYIVEYNVIKEIAAQGSCVIVGRCANHILYDDFECLDVFIHAKFDVRCKRAVEEYGAPPADVKKLVETIDKQRAKHCRHYVDREWSDVRNYHIAVDSGKYGIDATVELIKHALEEYK